MADVKLKSSPIALEPSRAATESREIVNHFGRSSHTYKSAARLQTEVANELLSLLLSKKKSNAKFRQTLDLGCGPGLMTQALLSQTERLFSLDLCFSMLSQNSNTHGRILANSHKLPFLDNSFDALFSSLMVQWCDLAEVLSEVYRVLIPGGRAVISTLVTGSLTELQQAWSEVDNDKHVHDYLSVNEVQQVMKSLAWQQVNWQITSKTYQFESVRALAKELKHLGANIVQGRQHKGLTPKNKWLAMEAAYEKAFSNANNQIQASYQVMYLELTK